jgi:hypothetical protein
VGFEGLGDGGLGIWGVRMDIIYSKHWIRKQNNKKKGITDEAIEYVLHSSLILRDKDWDDVFNAIARVMPSGRTLKVVYKKENQKIFIVTAYWLD